MLLKPILLIIGVIASLVFSATLIFYNSSQNSTWNNLTNFAKTTPAPIDQKQLGQGQEKQPLTNLPTNLSVPATSTGNTSTSIPVSEPIFATTSAPVKQEQAKPIPVSNLPVVQTSLAPSASPTIGVMRLEIPKLKINAVAEPVGVTPSGEMGIPKTPLGVVWYDLGPRPGEIGSAVISGHSGWKNGIHAEFDNLHNLVPGDKVYIQDESGSIITFVVRKLQTYSDTADATDVFVSSDGKAHLNLITCRGIWQKEIRSYTNRLVVFTDRE